MGKKIKSENVLILDIKIVKVNSKKKKVDDDEDEPDWDKLGLKRPDKYANLKTNSSPDFEFGWRPKTFILESITSIEDLADGECLFTVLNMDDYIVKTGFKEALKLIYNKEINE